METKKDLLINILKSLRKVGGIKGSSVISRDGLIIASDMGSEVDAETFAAMSAAMQGAAETAVSELKQGKVKQVVIEAEKGKIISTGAGELSILVILTESNINLGLLLLEMNKASKKIASVLKE